MSEPGESGVVNPLPSLVGDIFSGCRARYRPIDDRASYWTNFFFFGGGGGGINLENFQSKKKQNRITSGLEPMLIPLTVQSNYH